MLAAHSLPMKKHIARLAAIGLLALGSTVSAIADDFYFYFGQNTGYHQISGTTFFGGANQGFLSYPCIESNCNYGFGAEWWGIVNSNVPTGVYNTGGPVGGETVWVEIY